MNPNKLMTPYELDQAMAKNPHFAATEPGISVSQSLPTPLAEGPTLFVPQPAQETSHLITSPNEVRRQLRSGTSVGHPSAASSPITQSRRSTRAIAAPSRRTLSGVEGKTRPQDYYGFIDMDGGSEDEI